jgi:hypothetical protein
MKKIILSILSLALIQHVTNAQVISNHSFENWATTGSNPTDWTTSNGIVTLLGGTSMVVEKETSIVQEGNSSARLTSRFITSPVASAVVPGVVGLVTINALTRTYSPGKAFTSRPDSLVGYYQYTPAGGDHFGVIILLSKWNGTSRDTIGMATYTDNAASTTFNRFGMEINYRSTSNPDSILLVMSSSGDIPSAVDGSVAYVDNVQFVNKSTTSDVIICFAKPEFRLYPNPVNEMMHIETVSENANVQILDALGRLVLTQNNSGFLGTINVSTLQKGNYFLVSEGAVLKFIKE